MTKIEPTPQKTLVSELSFPRWAGGIHSIISSYLYHINISIYQYINISIYQYI
eukprot:SAG31_NODE_17649_length_663_cov_0.771277_1_plen_52_part_01